MFKLLTEEGRKKIEQEYFLRRIIVMEAALTAVFVIGLIGLFPSYLLSEARHKEVLNRVEVAGNTRLDQDDVDLRSWVGEINAKLRVLDPKLDTDRPSEFVEQMVSLSGAGVRISALSWVRADERTELAVSGVAADRQALVEFENGIRNSGDFSGVSLPVSNLARDRDIDFRIGFFLE